MRNLKRLTTSLVAIMLLLAFSSCEKQEADKENVAEISMKLNNFDFFKKALDDNPDEYPLCQEVDPYCVWVEIQEVDNPSNKAWYKVEMWDNDETDVLRWVLGVGVDKLDLRIVQFLAYAENSPACLAADDAEYQQVVLDGDGGTGLLKIAPSELSKFVENNPNDITGLPIDFTVKAFEKHPVTVDVLCYDPKVDYKNYGWNWFIMEDNQIEELCFFGNIHCNNYADWQQLGDYIGQQINGYAFGAVIKIEAYDDENMTNLLYEYDNTTNYGIGKPLCFPFVDTPGDDEYWIRILVQGPDGTDWTNTMWYPVYFGKVYEDNGDFTMDADPLFWDDDASDTGVRHFTLVCGGQTPTPFSSCDDEVTSLALYYNPGYSLDDNEGTTFNVKLGSATTSFQSDGIGGGILTLNVELKTGVTLNNSDDPLYYNPQTSNDDDNIKYYLYDPITPPTERPATYPGGEHLGIGAYPGISEFEIDIDINDPTIWAGASCGSNIGFVIEVDVETDGYATNAKAFIAVEGFPTTIIPPSCTNGCLWYALFDFTPCCPL